MAGIRLFAESGLRHSPQEYAALVEKRKPELLELRTGLGPVYLLPSRWERIRLQWAFRHFHVLCPELLSRGDRRLIEKMWRSGAVRPPWPVPRDRILGVIERVFPTAAKNSRGLSVVGAGSEAWPAAECDPPEDARLTASSPWQSAVEAAMALGGLGIWLKHSSGFQKWKGLVLLSAVCLAVVLAKVCGVPLDLGGARPSALPAAPAAAVTTPATALRIAPAPISAPPTVPAAVSAAVVAARATGIEVAKAALPLLVPVPLEQTLPSLAGNAALAIDPGPAVAQPAHRVDTLAPITAPAAPPLVASSAVRDPSPAAGRPFISELPLGRFSYPVVSDSNFVGTVTLRAVIGTDGLVKDVSVLSGDPKIAQAAAAAVKQWRYAPDELGGRTIEAETNIGISFFGQDAISVTSPHSSGLEHEK